MFDSFPTSQNRMKQSQYKVRRRLTLKSACVVAVHDLNVRLSTFAVEILGAAC